jgi:penicillin-binding protein 1C
MRPPFRDLLLGPWLTCALSGLLLLISLSIPFPELDAFRREPWSLRFTDRTGETLQILPINESGLRREFLPLGEIPPRLVRIMLVSEDRRFFLHPGIDPAAVIRALFANRSSGRIISGASTVSMQLARRIAPAGYGMRAKLIEAWNALRLELRLSKREILELWLNTLPLGSNVEGIASGSREYFGRDAGILSLEESALLALIPRNPRRYAPAAGNLEARDAALALLGRAGYGADPAAVASAIGDADLRAQVDAAPFRAPHFVRFAVSLYEGNGKSPVATTLDMSLQTLLEDAVAARVKAASEFRIGNGAAVVLSSETGEILAWTGSADFFDAEHRGQIDGVRMTRQPGSTIKPFLYALALESGMTPATLLPDVPLAFGGEAVYTPENFSSTYHGPVRLRVALASSLNIPAVYTVTRIGVAPFVERLLDLGFDSLEDQKESVGSGIALGNAELSLLELTAGFSVFRREGVYLPPGLFLDEPKEPGRAVIDPGAAFLVCDILSSERGRIPGFGSSSILNTSFDAMFKTGTSSQFANIWALGATEKLTVGVWMGNFTGETVIGRPGSSLPAAAAVEFLTRARENPRYRSPERTASGPPPGIIERRICSFSGEAAGPFCPGALTELFIEGTEPALCRMHRAEGTVLPPKYREWAAMKGFEAVFDASEGLAITSPAPGAVYYLDEGLPGGSQTVRVEAAGSGEISLFINESPAVSGPSPLAVRLPLRRGEYRIEAISGSERAESKFFVR